MASVSSDDVLDSILLEASLLYENSIESDYDDCFVDSLTVEACQKYEAASVLSDEKRHGNKDVSDTSTDEEVCFCNFSYMQPSLCFHGCSNVTASINFSAMVKFITQGQGTIIYFPANFSHVRHCW